MVGRSAFLGSQDLFFCSYKLNGSYEFKMFKKFQRFSSVEQFRIHN